MAAPSVGWVDLSVINGEFVVKDGVIQTLDLQVITPSLCTPHLPDHSAAWHVVPLWIPPRVPNEPPYVPASTDCLYKP